MVPIEPNQLLHSCRVILPDTLKPSKMAGDLCALHMHISALTCLTKGLNSKAEGSW